MILSDQLSEIQNRLAQPFLQRDFRFPAEEFLCEGDVGLAALGVVGR